MPADHAPDSNASANAEDLLLDFLDSTLAEVEGEFEALCTAHPSQSSALRRLYAGHIKVQEDLQVFDAARRGPSRPAQIFGARVGDRIGEFRLDARIASGGQGEVWEATQISLSRKVALKLVLPDRINEKTLALFAREARAGGRLAHPNIVAVHGYGDDDGRHWISQELIEGAWSLRDFIDEVRKADELPENYYRAVAVFIAELADALQAAHDAGVIHRDVKPQNVLVTPDHHPKLTDFGLARITDETAVSMTGDFAGTWLYMSPEQVTAKRIEVDHRTDIFSLGIVMYEMLVLQRPFDGDTTHQIAENIVMREAPDLRKIRSRVPRDLAVICGKALEKLKDARYPSMAEFAADLRRHLANEPIHAQPPTLIDRSVKWVRRHPTKSLVGTIATLAFVAISALALRISSHNTTLAAQQAEQAKTNEAQAVVNDDTVKATTQAQASQESADTSAAQARASEAEAKASLAEVLRLALSQDIDDLVSEADALWPAFPERIADLENWIVKAKAIAGRLPGLQETLAGLQPADGAQAEEDPRARWWRHTITGLIEKLEGLSAEGTGLVATDGVSKEHGWSVPRRLDSAQRLEEGFAPGGEFLVRWEAAAPAIKSAYPGLDLPVQMGLVPIGADPASGLWEFWHVESGTEPARGEGGVLELDESSGLVFVLIPGGKFWMGASADENAAHNYDPGARPEESPVHEVELSAFFLSKYEMTQGQWLRLSGANPSRYGPGTKILNHVHDLTHPVEQVSWFECDTLLRRRNLILPSESRWEHGCRGGSNTPRPFGEEEFATSANIRDKSYGQNFWNVIGCEEWSDGYGAHGPVGRLSANEFGLHDVIGNVWEWCLDGYEHDSYGRSSGVDPANTSDASADRASRGGCFSDAVSLARTAFRNGAFPRATANDLGLRPARGITPFSFTTSPSSND